MDVREKLVELLSENISEFCKLSVVRGTTKITAITLDADRFADHLIAHGVTVLPCNVGDKIYQTDGVRIYESTIGEITLTTKHAIFVTENVAFDESAIGKSIFLSYWEAEAHLPQPQKGE